MQVALAAVQQHQQQPLTSLLAPTRTVSNGLSLLIDYANEAPLAIHRRRRRRRRRRSTLIGPKSLAVGRV